MCGLAGVAHFGDHRDDAVDGPALREMAARVAHRGPDAAEIRTDGPVGLAFARLSLVAPVGGGQPLVSADGSLVLIANGEVYNHRELAATLPPGSVRGGSDCEVLLPLYRERGLRFLDDVHGMFALILWDRRENTLVLARDRFGIKPLYHHRDDRRIVLASEMKALFTQPGVPRRLDWEAALDNPFLAASPALGEHVPSTWFAGIESVPAATIRRVDLRDGTLRDHTYWSLPDPDEHWDIDDAEVVERYRELLIASITDCATADTELGLFLSGGVDSAVVASVAREHAPGLNTFSVLSASTYLNGDAPAAAEVAARLGLPNHQVLFPAARVPGVDEWKQLLWLVENPMCGPEQFYKHELHRYAKTARPQLRGMLLGAAADEFAGGYTSLYGGDAGWGAFEVALREMAGAEQDRHRPGRLSWPAFNGRSLLRDGGGPARDDYATYTRLEWRKIQQYNCWHEDRTAAGSGIEARVPFLDHRLVELVVRMPRARREALLWNKRIVRDAARPLLGPGTADREKVPFYHGAGRRHTHLAFARMLTAQGCALVEEALAAPGAADHLDADAVRGLTAGLVQDPDEVHVEMLLRLVNLGLLAGMAGRDMPPPLAGRASLPPVAPRREFDPADRALAAELGCPPLDAASVLAWSDSVRVLQVPGVDESYVIAVDDELQFTVDADSPEWLSLLRCIDGERALGSLGLGELGPYLPLLADAVGQDLLVEITS